MSVSLTPINDPDSDSLMDVSNGTWDHLTKLASPPVIRWNQLHDTRLYSPEELRAIAKVIPAEWASYGWAESLEELAKAGGAILS